MKKGLALAAAAFCAAAVCCDSSNKAAGGFAHEAGGSAREAGAAAAELQNTGGADAASARADGAAAAEFQNIEGRYVNDEYTVSFVELTITKEGDIYTYEMITPSGKREGNISFSDNPEYVTLEGIPWASWDNDESHAELPAPDSVDARIDDVGLVIQNYGNADNNYKIFDDIEDKYITLTKQAPQ